MRKPGWELPDQILFLEDEKMADAAIRIQEAFPGAGSFSESSTSTKLTWTERFVQSLDLLLRKSGAMENRMETYRYSVASKVPFHCEHI